MPKKSGSTEWGAFHESLGKLIKETLDKLEQVGVPSPTKIEASALIAYRQENNITHMTADQIKKFILKMRGFDV